MQPSLNSDPPGSALWFAPSRIVVYPIARAWLRGYSEYSIRIRVNLSTGTQVSRSTRMALLLKLLVDPDDSPVLGVGSESYTENWAVIEIDAY